MNLPLVLLGPGGEAACSFLARALDGCYETAAWEPRAAGAPYDDAPLAAVLVAPEVLDALDPLLEDFRAQFPTLPALLVQPAGLPISLKAPFANEIFNVLLAQDIVDDGGSALLRTLYSLQRPAWATRIESLCRPGATIERRRIRSREQKKAAMEEIEERLFAGGFDLTSINFAQVCLEESLNNGLYHAFRDAGGARKYGPSHPSQLAAGEVLVLEYAVESGQLVIGVADNAGNLDLDTLCRKLRADEMTESLDDEHGRGLFLLRGMCREAVFNLSPGRLTQCLLTIPTPAHLARIRPLAINRLAPSDVPDGLWTLAPA